MAEQIIEQVYHLKGGEEIAVEYANPLLDRREPFVVYCKDGLTRLKIGDGDSQKEVLNFKTKQNFPNIGDANVIYKVENEAKLYQWNSSKLVYEPLDNVDVEVDIGDIEIISGGQASDLIKV